MEKYSFEVSKNHKQIQGCKIGKLFFEDFTAAFEKVCREHSHRHEKKTKEMARKGEEKAVMCRICEDQKGVKALMIEFCEKV